MRLARLSLTAVVALLAAACSPSDPPRIVVTLVPNPIPVVRLNFGKGASALGATWTVTVTKVTAMDAVLERVDLVVRDTNGALVDTWFALGTDLLQQGGDNRLDSPIAITRAWLVPTSEGGPPSGPFVFEFSATALDVLGHRATTRTTVREAPRS